MLFRSHNGIIENYQKLKKELTEKGHKFVSDTDTEVLAHLVRSYNKILMPHNYVILEDHPDAEEITSGIRMNFGYCPIIVCQQLDKLTAASEQLKAKGYYDTWSQEDLDKIVSWRHK